MNKWRQKRSVRYRYDATAQMYDQRYCDEQEAKYHTAIDGLNIAEIVVLDVGCGTGMFFNYVADKASLVIGLDISRGLLLQANKRAKQQENVFVVLGDADHLPFTDDFFGLIFAFTVLQNMPKPVETLRELSRVATCEAPIVATALKRAIPLETFSEMLEQAGLKVASLRADEALQCFVVVSFQDPK